MNLRLLFKTFISVCFISIYACENKNSVPEDNEDNQYVLESKTIYVKQVIEGVEYERSVIIQTPNSIDSNRNYPLVFAFHGRGGSNTNWINSLKSYTSSGQFIGIYPQGFLESWNLGKEPSKANDVAFVDMIFEELKNYDHINFDKAYAIGVSNGSGMVNKLGIETNHFKAIAPVVSQLIESLPIQPNTRALSVYQINGAADDVIPIDGGPKFGHIFLDAGESARLWAEKFNCDLNPDIQQINGDTLTIYENCDDDKEIRYLRVENGGHGLLNESIIEDIWTFFQRF